MTQYKVNQNFSDGKKQYKRGDTIKRKPNWPNFNSMVNSGMLELIEEAKEINEVCNGSD